MFIATILLLSFGGAIIAAVVGTFWYSTQTPMGKLHMQYIGFDKLSEEEKQRKITEAKPKMPKLYAMQMALSFLTAFSVVFIITMSVQNGVPFMMALGFVVFNWLCLIVPTLGGAILWGNCDPKIAFKKFFFESSFNLVVLLLTALLVSLFV